MLPEDSWQQQSSRALWVDQQRMGSRSVALVCKLCVFYTLGQVNFNPRGYSYHVLYGVGGSTTYGIKAGRTQACTAPHQTAPHDTHMRVHSEHTFAGHYLLLQSNMAPGAMLMAPTLTHTHTHARTHTTACASKWAGPGEPDRPGNSYSNNTLSLPRDLSITKTGQMRQRFAPELRKLRRGHTHVGKQTLATGGVPKAQFIAGAAGLQLEIIATFSRTPTRATGATRAATPEGKFGILVLAAGKGWSATAIQTNQTNQKQTNK